MLEKIKNHIPHNPIALFSSFTYIICAMFLPVSEKMIISFLLLVFLTSLFYHSHPENFYFRLADWTASFSFIFYIFKKAYLSGFIFTDWILYILVFISILSWIISFLSFERKEDKAYEIAHPIWHLFSSATVYYMIYSLYISL